MYVSSISPLAKTKPKFPFRHIVKRRQTAITYILRPWEIARTIPLGQTKIDAFDYFWCKNCCQSKQSESKVLWFCNLRCLLICRYISLWNFAKISPKSKNYVGKLRPHFKVSPRTFSHYSDRNWSNLVEESWNWSAI